MAFDVAAAQAAGWVFISDPQGFVAEKQYANPGATASTLKEVSDTLDGLVALVEQREFLLGGASEGQPILTVEYPNGVKLTEAEHVALRLQDLPAVPDAVPDAQVDFVPEPPADPPVYDPAVAPDDQTVLPPEPEEFDEETPNDDDFEPDAPADEPDAAEIVPPANAAPADAPHDEKTGIAEFVQTNVYTAGPSLTPELLAQAASVSHVAPVDAPTFYLTGQGDDGPISEAPVADIPEGQNDTSVAATPLAEPPAEDAPVDTPKD